MHSPSDRDRAARRARSSAARSIAFAVLASLSAGAGRGRAAKIELVPPPEVALREVLASGRAPSAAEIELLASHLGARDPGMREAIIARLRPLARDAAGPVVRLLDGQRQRALAPRLSAFELLRAWGAPVAGLDPWRPETVSAGLPRLVAWARSAGTAPDAPASGAEIDRDLALLRGGGGGSPRAAAALERLAAAGGPGLLARVRALEVQAARGPERERLATLRWRLVVPPALAIRDASLAPWLATADGPGKCAIVERLRAAAADDAKPVLIELFLDPQPLVRETAMKALRAREGLDVTADLGRLLEDRDPNVRAAVLKELTERPLRELVPRVVALVRRETDEDLLVHACRALGNTPGAAATRCLLSLVRNASWRVRAEALEAFEKKVAKMPVKMSDALQQEARSAVMAVLEDPDGYVASRAIAAARKLEMDEAAPVIARVAERDPALAIAALESIVQSRTMARAAARTLRKLVASKTPSVREAAIRALARSTEAAIGDEVEAALGDADSAVRLAALAGLLEMLRAGPSGWSSGSRLERKWPAALSEPLVRRTMPLLRAKSGRERLAAARVLAALGRRVVAFPFLLDSLSRHPDLVAEHTDALADLDWSQRHSLFEALAGPADTGPRPGPATGLLDMLLGGSRPWRPLLYSPATEAQLVTHLADGAPVEAVPYFWQLLESRHDSAELIGPIATALFSLQATGGYQWTRPGRAVLEAMTRQARAHLDRTRTGVASVALGMLLYADPDAGWKEGRDVFALDTLPSELRLNALRLLLAQPRTRAHDELALHVLRSGPSWALEPALAFLATGQPEATVTVGGSAVPGRALAPMGGATHTEAPPPPRTLTLDLLRPHLTSERGLVACYAAQLLALSGDAGGLPVLIRRWKNAPKGDDARLRELLSDAIVALDDDSRVPHLAELYDSLDDQIWESRKLYQKLRLMTGSNAKELRKRIRGEVGKENLR
jgi:HEAT repeat protein